MDYFKACSVGKESGSIVGVADHNHGFESTSREILKQIRKVLTRRGVRFAEALFIRQE